MVERSHVTWKIQSECFISVKRKLGYTNICLWHRLQCEMSIVHFEQNDVSDSAQTNKRSSSSSEEGKCAWWGCQYFWPLRLCLCSDLSRKKDKILKQERVKVIDRNRVKEKERIWGSFEKQRECEKVFEKVRDSWTWLKKKAYLLTNYVQ